MHCALVMPDGMYAGSFPDLPGTFNRAALANRRQRTITIFGVKEVRPDVNAGGESRRPAHGSVSWKLTLTRVR